eukprot:Rhum_TRINITY_DN25167_c0_g1::Rhum_TRINITY_DN25167_c0_g1_i1::g.181464::m.181464
MSSTLPFAAAMPSMLTLFVYLSEWKKFSSVWFTAVKSSHPSLTNEEPNATVNCETDSSSVQMIRKKKATTGITQWQFIIVQAVDDGEAERRPESKVDEPEVGTQGVLESMHVVRPLVHTVVRRRHVLQQQH